MITVAIAEVFYFVEFNPLSDYTGGENGLPGVPTPSFDLGFTTLHFNTDWSLYAFLAFWYFVGIVIALRIVRSPVGAILQRDPRQSAARRRRRPQHPRLQAHRLRHRRRLCRLCRRPARRDAGLHAAGRLHVRHLRPARDADRDRRRRHAVRAAGRRRRLALSCSDFLQTTLHLGADLEAGARRRVRAAGLLPAPRHRRRPASTLCSCASPAPRQADADGRGRGRAAERRLAPVSRRRRDAATAAVRPPDRSSRRRA